MGYWDLSPPMLAAKEGLGSSFPNVLNVAVLSWETEHPGVRRCWALGTGTGKEPQQCSVCDLTFPNAAARAWYFGLLTPGQPWLLLVDQHPWCLWVDLCKPIGFCAHLCPPNSPWKLSCEQAVLCRGSIAHRHSPCLHFQTNNKPLSKTLGQQLKHGLHCGCNTEQRTQLGN